MTTSISATERAAKSFELAGVPKLPSDSPEVVRVSVGNWVGHVSLPAELLRIRHHPLHDIGERGPISLFWPTRSPWWCSSVRWAARAIMIDNLGYHGERAITQMYPEMVILAAALPAAREVSSLVHVPLDPESTDSERTITFAVWSDATPWLSPDEIQRSFQYDRGIMRTQLADADLEGRYGSSGVPGFVVRHALRAFGGRLSVVSGDMRVDLSGNYEDPDVEVSTLEGNEGTVIVTTLPHHIASEGA